jgi:hypothetical protein
MLIQNYIEYCAEGKEIFLPEAIKKPDGLIHPVHKRTSSQKEFTSFL